MAITLLTLFALGYLVKFGATALISMVSYKVIISLYDTNSSSTDYPTNGSPIVPPDPGDDNNDEGGDDSSDSGSDDHHVGTDPSGFT